MKWFKRQNFIVKSIIIVALLFIGSAVVAGTYSGLTMSDDEREALKEERENKKQKKSVAKEEKKRAEEEAKEKEKKEQKAKREEKEKAEKAEKEEKKKEEKKQEEKEKAKKEEKQESESESEEKEVNASEKEKELTQDEVIEQKITELVEDESGVKINKIDVVENHSDDADGGYNALIHLVFDVQNRAKTAKGAIDANTDRLGSELAGTEKLENVTFFWEVPYLLEENNIVKINAKQEDGNMYRIDEWYDGRIFD